MDKDNKYYSLIEKLVKENRKYPGYEAILDDIIDDVYKHSQVIISAIDNESVLNAYIEKVITTSIITVAKKMNFNNHIKHRVITEDSVIKEKFDDTESYKIDKSTDLGICDINEQTDIEESTFNDKSVNDDIKLQNPDIDTIGVTELHTDIAQEVFNNNEPNLEELISVHEDKDIGIIDEENDAQTSETSQKADPELVDMMINSINSDMILDVGNNDGANDVKSDEFLDVNEDLYADSSDEIVNYSKLSNIDNLDELQVEDSSQYSEYAVDNDVEELNEPVEIETDDVEAEYNNTSENNIEDIETVEMSDIQEPDSVNESEPQAAEIESIAIDNEDNLELNTEYSEGYVISDNLVVQNEMTYELDAEIENSSDYNNIHLEDDIDESVITDDNNLIMEESGDNSIEFEEESNFNGMLDIAEDHMDDLNVDFNDDSHSDEIMDASDNGILYEETVSEDNFGINIELNDEVLDVNIDNDDISMVEEPNLIKLDETNNIEGNLEPVSDSQHKNIDYSAFGYEPNIGISDDGDVNGVSSKIIELDVSKPNLQILKIFDLKYKQNLTLDQIAENLGMEKQDVVKALDELIDLI